MTDCTMTLGAIRAAGPCGLDLKPERTGFRRLLAYLGEPDVKWNPRRRVSLGDIAQSNGAMDAVWCIRCLDWADVAVRRVVIGALLPALRRAAIHTTDERVGQCVDALTRWCAGEDVDLVAVRAAI